MIAPWKSYDETGDKGHTVCGEKWVLHEWEPLFRITLYFLPLRQRLCRPRQGRLAMGARAEEPGPRPGSSWYPLLARTVPQWALAPEGLQRRGDAVARHRLLGNALFLLAWPPPQGPKLLWSSSCLLQPLADLEATVKAR